MEPVVALWKRDVIKFFRDRARLLGSFAMPFMFLVIFGSGISGAISSMFRTPGMETGLEAFDYVSYMFPGIIAMTVFTTAIFSASLWCRTRRTATCARYSFRPSTDAGGH
jgi:ABC-2 type transport system permease protein